MTVRVCLVTLGVRVAPLVVGQAQGRKNVRARGGGQGRQLVGVPGGLADLGGGVGACGGVLGVRPLA